MRLVHTCILILFFISLKATAQNTYIVSGTVKSEANNESLSAVSIFIKGTSTGTYTDEKGFFKLTFSQQLPVTLAISSIGYADKEVTINNTTESLAIILTPSYELGKEIVVAASRTPERILESPVSIERVNTAAIRNTAAASYYDILANLKGVDVTTSSLNFKTPSTRGFNGSGNLRFNQFVDGMDNTAPALNFSVGNVIGLTELDVDNMELLPGSSSALYGSGGMNGTLLITSKNPFKYQGFSAQVKEGVMHINDPRHKASPYHDIALRWGKKVSEKFAFKIGGEFIKADDWQANDKTNLERNNVLSKVIAGTRTTDPNYDGVNVYGDEASAGMKGFAQTAIFAPSNTTLPIVIGALGINPNDGLSPTELGQIIGYYADNTTGAPFGPYHYFAKGAVTPGYYDNQNVSRTGYDESDMVDYGTENIKISGGLYYKLNAKTEASLTGNWGEGTTVYTGADRYSLKNFTIGQYKLEVRNENWFLRAYTTQENSGDSYATTIAALTINDKWKGNADWFGTYMAAYSMAKDAMASTEMAHAAARAAADEGRLMPGTQAFKDTFNKVISLPIGQGGAKFADKSDLYQVEGQLNLTQYIKVLEVLAGADYRTYSLKSNNTIFRDEGGLNIGEYGGYLQLQKRLFDNFLKLSAAGRYDKSKNFKGRFTPRFTASVKIAQDNNIRLSYQQAYRFPNNQDQYIDLNSPGSKLIGGLPMFATIYGFAENPVFTATSIAAARAAQDPTKLVVADFVPVKPETMESFEVGYRGIIAKKLLIDAYFYTSKYKDFIARQAVARGVSGNPATSKGEVLNPFTSSNFSFVSNSPTPVKANGWGIGIEYQFVTQYLLTANVYSDELHDVPEGLVTFFNTPKTRFNVGLANSNVYKNIGFNVMYKWQDKVYWEGTFGTGTIPAFGTLDAQISYKLVKAKSMIKLGATNLTNHYYRNAFGNPYVGGLYYLSIGFNVL